jgi:predicted unusual protein kinase regulating ubiquinone biosynthesis (AarF/ABC1/UbiB family)
MVADAHAPDLDAARKPVAQLKRVKSFRFVRAYFVTFTVIASYVAAGLGRRLFGNAWYDDRRAALHRRNARRVERTILELQGLFIKVGQLLSIMTNFLPDEFRTGLEALQDQVPPRPFSDIEERVVREFGKPVDQVFAKFDRKPLASASLGQVHEAELADGTRVAVKVQHRNIERITRLDLRTIRRIMRIVQLFVPVRGLDAYYHQIRQMIAEELDFTREADNIDRVSRNFEKDSTVVFPKVVREYSTRHVLTSSFLDGVKVWEIAALDAAGVDRKALAKKIVRTYCQMIFVDGVYHADPHPGNVFVRPDGSLILLDFGAVAELSPSMREGIPEFLEGVIRRDTDRIIDAMRKMGFLAIGDEGEVSARVIEYFHRRFHQEVRLDSLNLKDIRIDPQKGFENLIDLRRMNIGLRELSSVFRVPRDFVLLERTLLLLTGICTQLDPEMNPMDVVGPYLHEFVLGTRDWRQIALEAAKDIALTALTLPEDLSKYLTKSIRGEVEVRVRGLPESARMLYAAVRQLVYALFTIAAASCALVLRLHGEVRLVRICLWVGGVSALLLFYSMLTTKTKLRR